MNKSKIKLFLKEMELFDELLNTTKVPDRTRFIKYLYERLSTYLAERFKNGKKPGKDLIFEILYYFGLRQSAVEKTMEISFWLSRNKH